MAAPGAPPGPSRVTLLLGAEKGEAACGRLHGTQVATRRAGYTGAGYVTGFDGPYRGVTVTAQQGRPGRYRLKIRYAAPQGDQRNKLLVNQTSIDEPGWVGDRFDKSIPFPKTTEWKEADAGVVSLKEGDNRIKLYAGTGGIDVDYFKLEPVD